METSGPKLKIHLLFQEVTFQAQKIKIPTLKKSLFFYIFFKIPLGETGCLNNLYYLLTAQASSFLIHHPFCNTASQNTFVILSLTMQHLCDLQDPTPLHVHQVLPTQPLPQGARIYVGVACISRMCLSPHS